jgi:hypothetical protein
MISSLKRVVNSDHIKSEISLIGAHDPANKSGGYRLRDKGVKQLINIFDNFIDALNNVQNTEIKVISDSHTANFPKSSIKKYNCLCKVEDGNSIVADAHK